MCTAGTLPQIAALADSRSAAPLQRREQSPAIARPTFRDTLHCRPHVAGSAAQFNQSVSPMPHYACSQTNAPARGTADTLSKGYAS